MTKTDDDGVGSVAEEAAKLFAALQFSPSGTSGSSETDSQQPGDTSRECQWCPICQLIRRVSPETVEHLTAAAAGVLSSVRGFLDAAAEAAAEKSGTPDAEAGTESGASGKVDRIDVSEDPERWD